MTWFVLVPGACHGGWTFEPIAERLRAAGHTADAITLTGLEPEPATGPINLDTHLADVHRLLDSRDEPAVLVGHSYAGSVITGVADARPDRVGALVYLDAFVPRDGDACWTMINQAQLDWYVGGAGATGLAVGTLPFFDDRARPHPVGTLLQRSRITGAYEDVRPRHYLLATGAEWLPQSPFPPVAERLRAAPGWTVTDVDCGHNIAGYAPDELMRLLLELARWRLSIPAGPVRGQGKRPLTEETP